MAKVNLKKTATLAVLMTIVLLAVNFLLAQIGYPVSTLYAVEPISAIGTGQAEAVLGNNLIQNFLAWIGGVIPIESFLMQGTILTFISAFLVLITGSFLVNMFNLPTAKGKVGMLASVILWGWAAFYVVVVGVVAQSPGIFVGLAVHTVILAFGTAWLADKMKVQVT